MSDRSATDKASEADCITWTINEIEEVLGAVEAVIEDGEIDFDDVTTPEKAKTAQLELVAHIRDQLCDKRASSDSAKCLVAGCHLDATKGREHCADHDAPADRPSQAYTQADLAELTKYAAFRAYRHIGEHIGMDEAQYESGANVIAALDARKRVTDEWRTWAAGEMDRMRAELQDRTLERDEAYRQLREAKTDLDEVTTRIRRETIEACRSVVRSMTCHSHGERTLREDILDHMTVGQVRP